MRKEIIDWFRQAENDLYKAEILFAGEAFDGAVFFYHQAVEKALKALFLLKFRETPSGHSILLLAKKLNVPKELIPGIKELNTEYLTTRYPDIAQGPPFELYDKNIASRHRELAKKVIKWVKSKINQK